HDFEAYDFFRSDRFVNDPYSYFDYLREQSPVLREPHQGIFMVTGYDEAVEIYNDSGRFSSCMSTTGPFAGCPIPLEGHENEDISELIEAYRQGNLLTAHYRGRACYPKIVQAAEYFIRHALNIREIKRLKLINDVAIGDSEYTITFADTATQAEHTVRLKVDPAGFQVLSSCSDTQPSPSPAYQLVSID
ncbi:MAG: hypothetical protein ACK2UW_07995, partial [Anaerolineales bacterium]